MKDRVSVIIIAKNEPRIDYTLQSLLHQTVKPYEVIVVVDDIDDISAKIAEKYIGKLPIKIVVNDMPGYGGARRKGVEEASGDIIAFISADCIADRKWIESIVSMFSTSNVMVQAGKTININSFESYRKINTRYAKTPKTKILRFAPAQNFAFKKELVNVVGNFDPWFSEGGEDLDFCIRLRKKGFNIYYNPNAIVYHFKHRLKLQRAWRDGRSRAKAFIKHGKVLLSDALTCFFHTLSLFSASLLSILGFFNYAMLALIPSLLHRLYRMITNVLYGESLLESCIEQFITYISHISFTLTAISLSIKRL